MKINEIRKMSSEELSKKITETKEELFNKVVKESACYKLQGGDN